MKRTKDGKIIFDNSLELNRTIKEKIKPMLNDVISKAKQDAVREALELMVPLVCNALYESHGFGPKRQEQFLKCVHVHLQCLDEGVTTIDDYEKWCKDSGIKTFNSAGENNGEKL